MKITRLNKIKQLCFSREVFAQEFGISLASASVTISRYVKAGILVKTARDNYMLRQRFENMTLEENYHLATHLQVPSYVSFVSALYYYGLFTQVEQGVTRCAAMIRSKEVAVEGLEFRYVKLKEELYFGFERVGSFFIATPEKALADTLYLAAFGKYKVDWSSLEVEKIDMKTLYGVLDKFPLRVGHMWERVS